MDTPPVDQSPQKNAVSVVSSGLQLSPDERSAILAVLTQCFLTGQSMREAFDSSDRMGRSTFYKLRAQFPDEVDATEEEARQRAIELRDAKREKFTAHREDAGIDVATTAAAGLQLAIPELVRIAQGKHVETKDSRGRTKIIFTYARDIAQASALLHQLSKEGLWREDEAMPVLQQNKAGDALPAFVGRNWTKAAVQLDDGTVIMASKGDVIEGEVEEV